MVEVVHSNFQKVLPNILHDIEKSQFIAIDTEFSGLVLSDKEKPSLFDNGDRRYAKLRESVSNFTLTQIGLAMFINAETDPNKYMVNSYNIFLFPCVFGPVDVRYGVQASSFGFLCKHDFDFNKCIYSGVSFVNDVQEEQLRQFLKSQDHYVEIDNDMDNKALQDCCSDVAQWILTAKDGDTINLDPRYSQELSEFIILSEIRQRFPEAWAFTNSSQMISVEKVRIDHKRSLEKEIKEIEDQRILDDKIGFTKVFRKLVDQKKPLIGHNCLMDLLFMYDKFYEPLPKSLSTFKYNFMKMFPRVFDTKHIVIHLRRQQHFRDEGILEETGLSGLYSKLESDKVKFRVLYSPAVIHGPTCSKYAEVHRPHEAGYDAYMVGVVFLRMAHLNALLHTDSTKAKPLPFHKYLLDMEPYLNRVNLIRASIEYLVLDGRDPVSRRPEWLFVSSKHITQPLTVSQLARLFSTYGSVDIHLRSSRQALVALTTFRSSKDILRAFRGDSYISVVKYNIWRHSPVIRGVMWAGVALTGGLAAWAYLGMKPSTPSKS